MHGSNTVKDTDFKFDKHVLRDSPESGHDPLKFFGKRVWPGTRDPLNFWALNFSSSNTVKRYGLEIWRHVPRDSPDMIP